MTEYNDAHPYYDTDDRHDRLGRRRALRKAGRNPETGEPQTEFPTPVARTLTPRKKRNVTIPLDRTRIWD